LFFFRSPSEKRTTKKKIKYRCPLAKSQEMMYLLCIYSKEITEMKTRVQKWGNSLALRIPKSFAIEAGLDQDAEVDVALVEGKLIVTPLPIPTFSLEQLLARITDDNRHDEYDTGPAVGNEV
jgi:antitoxin MazE